MMIVDDDDVVDLLLYHWLTAVGAQKGRLDRLLDFA